MTAKLIELFRGCQHDRITWPQTPRDKEGKRLPPYVVCLNCGSEFLYDLKDMKITGRRAC